MLQEHYFRLLAFYASGNYFQVDTSSSRALARSELKKIDAKIQGWSVGADAASVAHLGMLQDRIKRLLDASLTVGRP